MQQEAWARRAVRSLLRTCTTRAEAALARYRYACERIIARASRR